MCSIIGSFSKGTIDSLAKLNSYRGQHSHSVYVFDSNYQVIYSHKAIGELNINDHNLPEGYIVVHQQAPTTDAKDDSSIHPAQIGNHLLWHNGIIKVEEIKALQKELESTINWDTKLMLQYMVNNNKVGDFDGTFSCLWYDGQNLYLFRNEISPMFIDDKGNISSTMFSGATSIEPNCVWLFTPDYPTLDTIVQNFKTVENPYYFGDE